MQNSSQNRLDFTVPNGIAKGYRVVLTLQNVQFHQNKYGRLRPELNDPNFFDKEVVDAINDPTVVYPAIEKIDPISKQIKFQKNVYVFYKERVRFFNNGIEVIWYTKVTARKYFFKKLIIITPYYSAKINEAKKCLPKTQI
jgi:hypothetical protein